jgi:hypothetical protein
MAQPRFFAGEPGTKYRPSNGTEGEFFMSLHCARCQRDAAYRRDEGDSCPIVAWVMAVDVDDPKYPAEWQYGPDRQPTCTAFTLDAPPDVQPRCDKTPDLFGGEAA